MRNRNLWLAGLLVLLLASQAISATVSGKVFFDRDVDGAMGADEKPIVGVAVSDGQQVTVTSASGDYRLETDPGSIVFVSLPRGYRAAKSFYKQIDADCALDFPMAEWAASKADAVRFAQITDIHVTGEDTVDTLIADLAEINSLHPGAEFILATGDLVNDGKNVSEYENYVRSIATSRLPVFNVPGNHDAMAPASLPNYRHYLGPMNYSFNVGSCHLVVVNCLAFDDKQKAWIARDLAAAPAGSRRIVAMHYLPTQEQADYFSGLGVAAVLSGHWHGDRVRANRGLLDLNTPPLRFGGIDRTARSFRVVDVVRGNVKSDLRYGGFKHHAVVVTPSGSCASRNGKLQVLVNAYDSRCKVASVECLIGNRRLSLKQVSAWSWIGELAISTRTKTPQRVIAEIRDTDGGRWRAESVFRLDQRPNGLRLAAVAPTGGFVALSSPKGVGDTVAIGTSDYGDLKDCGIRVFTKDLVPKWSFHTDSAIKNNVAVSKDRVFATSIAGWLYSFDRATGKPLWKVELDRARERWEIAATTVDGGIVFVGGASYIGAFDEASGKRLWSTSLAKSDWWPSCYVVPVVTGGRLVLMTRVGAHAYEAMTGEPVWDLAGNFHGSAVAGGVIYTIQNNVPAAVDSATGKLLWAGKDIVGDTASSPAISGDKMVVGTADGRVCAYSAKDGALIWSFQTGRSLSSLQPYKRGLSDVNSSPAIAGGVVYVGASDGVLYALSLKTGKKLGSYSLGVPIASSPLVVDGRLYAAAYDGNVYAFDLAAR